MDNNGIPKVSEEPVVSEKVKLEEIDYALEIKKIKEKLDLYALQLKQLDIKKAATEIENTKKDQEIDLSKIL